jgi:membrane protein
LAIDIKRIYPRWVVSFLDRFGVSLPGYDFREKTLPLFWDWVRLVFREFLRNRLMMRASVLTLTTLLSLVPMLAVLFTFFDLFGGSQWLSEQLKPYLIKTLAGGVGDQAVRVLDGLLAKAPIGVLGGSGFFFLAVAGLSFLSSLEDSFNYIWKVTQPRSLFARFRNFWVAVTLVPLLILASTVASSSVQWSEALKSLLTPGVYAVLRSWGFPLFLEWLGFLLLFKLVPNVQVRFAPAALGAVIGAVLWEVAKRLYFLYTTMFVNYNILYGAFAALPLFFIWLNITFIILLFAVQTVYVTQHIREMRRFPLGYSDAFAPENIALNLLMDVTDRQLRGEAPLRINAAAARFEMRAHEFKQLLDKLVYAGIISKPNHDDDFLRLARDSDDLKLAQIWEALGKIPFSGLPDCAKEHLRKIEEQEIEALRKISLKDVVAAGSGERKV